MDNRVILNLPVLNLSFWFNKVTKNALMIYDFRFAMGSCDEKDENEEKEEEVKEEEKEKDQKEEEIQVVKRQKSKESKKTSSV